ncbi:MAG TPA: hypothetical protein VIH30_06110, partial [Aquirhabdus sp.]
MSLMRGKLLAGALFAGALFAHGEQVEAQVPQPLAGGGFVRERVVKYELRTFKAHTFQQLRQESGARLYAIDNSLSASAISQQRLRSAEFGYCEVIKREVSAPIQTVKDALQDKHLSAHLFVHAEVISTHYQLNQSQHSVVEVEAEVSVVKDYLTTAEASAQSVIRLQQSSVSE